MTEHFHEQINVYGRQETWGEGLVNSLPVVTGYLTVAFTFGLNATRPGFTLREAIINDFGLPLWALAYQVLPFIKPAASFFQRC